MPSRFKIPQDVKKDGDILAKDMNDVLAALRQMANIIETKLPQPGEDIGFRQGPGGVTMFLKRKGGGRGPAAGCYRPYMVLDDDGAATQIAFTNGRVVYRRLTSISTDGSSDSADESAPVFLEPVIPTIDGVPINEDGATIDVSGRDTGSAWLVCLTNEDGSDNSGDTEFIVLADRDAKPTGVAGNTYIRLCYFDLTDDGNGGKWLANVDIRWQSDWIQEYGGFGRNDGSDSADSESSAQHSSGAVSSGHHSSGGHTSGVSSHHGSSHHSNSGDEVIATCCPTIGIVASTYAPDCFPSSPGPFVAYLNVAAQIGDGSFLCPDCHDFAYADVYVAGVLCVGGGVPSGGYVTFGVLNSQVALDGTPVKVVAVNNAVPCGLIPITVVVTLKVKTGTLPADCLTVICSSTVYFRLPPRCGNSCSSHHSSH